MEKQYNPLFENWRGSRSPCAAAYLLHLTQTEYLNLESHPEGLYLKSDQIILIAERMNIPLEVLIDYLETPAPALHRETVVA